jgi:hypothetical protein
MSDQKEVPGQAMWDEWFDGQYDLNLCIDRVIKARSEGKPDLFKAALYSGVTEHCAEQMRMGVDFATLADQHQQEEATTEKDSSA